ncbi:MAG: DUF6502 family protein [Steroidobacteraceae bacterium]
MAKSVRALEAQLDAVTGDAVLELARLLVSAGYGFGAFEQHAKRAFVVAAKQALAAQGARRINRSMIAAATGLTRGEVAQLLRPAITAGRSSRLASRAARLVLAWRADARLKGRSLTLDPPKRGARTAPPSFHDLVKRYGGDIPPRAMQAELLRSGLAEKTRDGRLRLSNANRDNLLRAVQAVEATLPWLRAVAPQVLDPHPGVPIAANSTVATLPFASARELYAALDRILDRTSSLLDGFDQASGQPRAPGELLVGVAIAGSRPRR